MEAHPQFELIPQPRELTVDGPPVVIGGLRREPATLPPALALAAEGVDALLAEASACVPAPAAPAAAGAPTAVVRFRAEPSIAPEGYWLRVEGTTVSVAAADARGALHAARTLLDLFHQTAPLLPRVAIADRPGVGRRGIFVESFAGVDRMGLPELTELLDRLAKLKLNTVAMALYGCWDLRHDGGRCEYVMARLPGIPELRSPQRMRTWEPERGEEVVRDYLPRPFEEDVWGALVAHGRTIGVDVLPVWGGPAHSSLLPRTLPALSAVGADGEPKHYGCCVTGAAARAELERLFDEVVRTQLVPHGIDLLGCGGDEFYPIVNVDPEAPLRPVAPVCECETCAPLSAGEQLVEYLVLAARVLARHGVRMWIYHDSVVREGVLEQLRRRLAAARVAEPIVAWWLYTDPVPEIETPGETSWAMPTTGLVSGLFLQDTSENIEAWARETARAGATGVVAYNMPDPALHKNYACLADLTWNLEGSGGARGFGERWARRVAPADPGAALAAYDHGERVVGSQPLTMYLLNHLLGYFSTSPHGVHVFPDDVVRAISVPLPALQSLLRQAARSARVAAERMPATVAPPGWPDPGTLWRAELSRLAGHVELFCDVTDVARRLHGETLPELDEEVAALERRGRALLDEVAAAKPPFLRDVTLREHWMLVGELRPMLERMATDPALRPSARAEWHAWML